MIRKRFINPIMNLNIIKSMFRITKCRNRCIYRRNRDKKNMIRR